MGCLRSDRDPWRHPDGSPTTCTDTATALGPCSAMASGRRGSRDQTPASGTARGPTAGTPAIGSWTLPPPASLLRRPRRQALARPRSLRSGGTPLPLSPCRSTAQLRRGSVSSGVFVLDRPSLRLLPAECRHVRPESEALEVILDASVLRLVRVQKRRQLLKNDVLGPRRGHICQVFF